MHRDRADARLELHRCHRSPRRRNLTGPSDIRLRPPRRVRRHPQLSVDAPAQGGRQRRFQGRHEQHGRSQRAGEIPLAVVAQGIAAGTDGGLPRQARDLPPRPRIQGLRLARMDQQHQHGDGAQHHRNAGRGRDRGARSEQPVPVRELDSSEKHARARVARLLHRSAEMAGRDFRPGQFRSGGAGETGFREALRGLP